jgi:hypothetical protein
MTVYIKNANGLSGGKDLFLEKRRNFMSEELVILPGWL